MNTSCEFNHTPCDWCGCPGDGAYKIGDMLLCFYHFELIAKTVEHLPQNEHKTASQAVIPETYIN